MTAGQTASEIYIFKRCYAKKLQTSFPLSPHPLQGQNEQVISLSFKKGFTGKLYGLVN